MNTEIEQLISQLEKNWDILIETDTNDQFVVKMQKKKDEFQIYIESLDDDVFIKTCKIFPILTDVSINEFDQSGSEELKEKFKKLSEFIRNY